MVKSESEKSKSNEEKSSHKKKEEKSQSQDQTSKENIDKIGILFDRGIDLVETGLELGVNLVSKLGGVASDKASDILKTQMQGEAPGQKESYEDLIRKFTGQNKEPEPPQPSSPPQQEQENNLPVVSNRLPAFPGSEVKISFSIENESINESKQLKFDTVGYFIGDESNFQIEASAFKINPSKKSIAPMDFEKLVLSGKIPENAPPDIYKGLIAVSGEDQYQIPIVIIVSPSVQEPR